MKYYSELTRKTYDTEKDCLRAERDFKRNQEQGTQKQEVVKEDKTNKSPVSKEKKECADKITEAEKLLDEANKEYSVAQDKAAEILEKSNKEVKQILDEAKEKVRNAERVRRDALLEFNTKFGPYTTHYTGEKAIEEFNKAINRFNEPIYDLFRYFWKLF